MARTLLPSLIRHLYHEVVLACLMCLDPDTANIFINEKGLYDEDGILVAGVFVGQILLRLESISF